MLLLIEYGIILLRRILITLSLNVLITHLHGLNFCDPEIKYGLRKEKIGEQQKKKLGVKSNFG